MSITQKDFQALQPGVAELSRSISERKLAQQQSQQQQALEQLRAYLAPKIAGESEKAQLAEDINASQTPEAQDMIHNGGSVSFGKAHFGADPYAHMMATADKGEEAARQKAIQNYNKAYPKLQQQFQAANEGLSFVNDPKNIGSVGQAKTLMLKAMGMNRFNEDEAKAVLPQTLHQSISTFFNSGGGDNNPMDTNQRAMVNQFFKSQIHNVKQQHDMLKQGSLDTYDSSRYAAPNGHQTLQNKLGGGFSQALESADKQYSQVPATQGPNLNDQAVSPSILQQAISAGKRGLGSIFGSSQQPSSLSGYLKPQSDPQTNDPEYQRYQELLKKSQAGN